MMGYFYSIILANKSKQESANKPGYKARENDFYFHRKSELIDIIKDEASLERRSDRIL
ncbi:hypothetical protein [Candidatus Williamhamiltonella defendens]|uniref:hypothetical protein n=1 Tax=Candidatus Williamhamiltonella defendens TaxID=138072 RepID=UPI00165176A7|nr:hypothetical protein [Candidatus Hamiltonella defensa]